jgi:hypothetical protein
MTERPPLNLQQAPVSEFVSTDEAAKLVGVGRKRIEAACSAYRQRIEQSRSAAEAPDPHPLPHELPCLWVGARPVYLVYRPALPGFRVNRPGENTGRPGRKAGWRKQQPGRENGLLVSGAEIG